MYKIFPSHFIHAPVRRLCYAAAVVLTVIAKFPGSYVIILFEGAREIFGIIIADHQGDFIGFVVCAVQIFGRLFHAAAGQVIGEGLSGDLVKQP